MKSLSSWSGDLMHRDEVSHGRFSLGADLEAAGSSPDAKYLTDSLSNGQVSSRREN